MFVDIFNVADGSYGTYRVTAKTPGTNTDPDVEEFSALSMVFDVEFISGRGEPSGAATFKFYELVAGNPADYVRKDGDTTTGPLLMKGYTSDSKPLLKLAPETSLSNSSDVFAIRTLDNKKLLNVALNGNVSVNSDWVPSKTNSLTTKQYVDTSTAEITLGRKFKFTKNWNDIGNEGTSEHLYFDNSLIAWHPKDASGLDVRITSAQLGDGANPKFEKGNVTLWGYQSSTNQWRMIGCAVHDGEIHVKIENENTYFYVNVSWEYKPTINVSDWPIVRVKMDGYW